MRIQLIFILTVLLAVTSSAKTIDIFFGTSGKNSEGIYYATFNPENGKFTPSKLAAKIGSPGFLANHPNGKILYSVGRWDEGSGALGYHIGKNGELTEFTRMICPDGGVPTSQFIQVENFCLLLNTEAVRLPFFHLMQMENWGNPP